MSVSGRVTNLFLPEPEVQGLIERGEIEALAAEGALYLLRNMSGFRRLYFAAESADRLASVRLPDGEIITDVVGRAPEIEPVSRALAEAGFRPYKEFQRMARGPEPHVPGPGDSVRRATPDEAWRIHGLIHRYFDVRAEHLPSLEEVAEATRTGSILVVESEGAIAALLFHTTTRVTSTLRYWLVVPEFQGQGFGKMLIDRYLADCRDCRRFLLWVQRDNRKAIAKYEGAGYRPDGLLDQILRKFK
jgi:RimJ/RimL family protein N-acetyltransferase